MIFNFDKFDIDFISRAKMSHLYNGQLIVFHSEILM